MTTYLRKERHGEQGATLLEFAIGATVFLMVMFGVVEFGRCLWTHNALSDAARRGARYAINHPSSDADEVKNVAVYGVAAGGTKPLVDNLTTDNVEVQYSDFGLGEGTVSVSIKAYEFQFAVPLIGSKISMPGYSTTLTGENIGYVPTDIP
jgi:Flp pilus assembly protein TadG